MTIVLVVLSIFKRCSSARAAVSPSGPQRLFKSFLIRNELVASVRWPPDVIFAG